jgi:transmembrane sensor
MKKNYSSYYAADFARDSDFVKWVKYPGQDQELNDFWNNWLGENPAKKDEVEEARHLIRAILEQKYSASDSKQAEVWNKIRTTLHKDDASVVFDDYERKHSGIFWLKIAASIILVAGVAIGTFYLYPTKQIIQPTAQVEKPVFVKEENLTANSRTVVLPDGSSIILQPQSFIQFPKDFNAGEDREVFLTGEAFFEVKRDPTRPFLVHTNEIVTRVLGTSFTVRGFENENVVVRVKTGRVSVFKENKQKGATDIEGVVLTPNQQVVYEREQMKMAKSLIEDPVVLGSKTNYDFKYIDTPVRKIFSELEGAYGVDIVYDEEAFASCHLNASLSDMPLYDKLKLVCKGINATYEMLDSQIVIYGKGCHTKTDSTPNQ